MSQVSVFKRNGKRAPLDLEKLHRVVFWSCEGLTGVSPSEVEIRSSLQFYDGIKTTDIQETLIKSAADLISEDAPNYQYVAGRLISYHLRKEVYGDYEPWPIKQLVDQNVQLGLYDADMAGAYTDAEWSRINAMIRHDRDNDMAYVGMEQMRGKYLVQNRVTGRIYETPQMAYMLIAATLFQNYPAETRLNWVHDYYEAISTHLISLPTPVMAGVRTPQRQFSSCVLVETDDSLDSINATSSAIVKYVSQKAGIGIGAGRIRALNSPIRRGDA
jgi:ribonucleoside-diphosphate reductase alpha chain